MSDGFLDELTDRCDNARQVLALRGHFLRGETPPDALAQALLVTQLRIASRLADALPCGTSTLRACLGLTATELEVVWLLAALAVDSSARALLVRSHCTTVDPSLELIRAFVYGDRPSRLALSELAATGTLRRLGLIERSDGGSAELHESRWTWAIARRVLTLLHGDAAIDPALADLARIPDPSKSIAELAVADATAAKLSAAMTRGNAVVIALGPAATGRATILTAFAYDAQLALLEIDAKHLARELPTIRDQLRALVRECKLQQRAPLVRNLDALVVDGDASRFELLGRMFAADLESPILATCSRLPVTPRWGRPIAVVDILPPTALQRATLWQRALPGASEGDAVLLANRYPIAAGLVCRAAALAREVAAGTALQPAHIEEGVRSALDDRLSHLARRTDTTQAWTDIVLPDAQLAQITELCARVHRRGVVYETWGFGAKLGRGLGVTALFSGPPGTGKTMVAALIARKLGLELYQVDLSKVVSKWIGETEARLAELFDVAEAGHAILLFDEADALFGKRTEVKSSNDRYANLETNYLLQRLESFSGVCLLTSNHESGIDAAFQRRLSFHLRFEVPDEDERARLWRAVLPSSAPVDRELDLSSLARRFVMSGGYIRNAALRAAFVAADAGKPISASHLEYAARLEYEAIGKIAA